MKTEKIAVYSLTAILFALMMLAYWLPKTNRWNPFNSRTFIIFFFLLARTGGNAALLYFYRKISLKVSAGILAIILFLTIIIKSEALGTFILMFYGPVAALIIVYSWFRTRASNRLANFLKILGAGVSAGAFLIMIFILVGNRNHGIVGNDAGVGSIVFGFALAIGCIEIIPLNNSYALQKDDAKTGNDR